MPRLLKNIVGSANETILDNVRVIRCVAGEVGVGDYFKIYGVTAFLQDFTNTYEFTIYLPRISYGMNRESNNIIELNISY